MWWIAALSSVAAAGTPSLPVPARPRLALSQARVMVRIVNAARVHLGHSAIDRYELRLPATDTHFRDADGSYRPARIVEFP